MIKPPYRVRHFDNSQDYKGRNHSSPLSNRAVKLATVTAVVTIVITMHAGVLLLLSRSHPTSNPASRLIANSQPDTDAAIKIKLVKSDNVEDSNITNTQTTDNITRVIQPITDSMNQSTNQPLSEHTKKQPAKTPAVTTDKDKPQPLADINIETPSGKQTPTQSQPNHRTTPPAKSKETAHNEADKHVANHLPNHPTQHSQDRPSSNQASPNQESLQKATVQPSQPNNIRSTRNTDSVNSANSLNSTKSNSAKSNSAKSNSAKSNSAKSNSAKNPVLIKDSKEVNDHWKIAPQPSISIAARRQIKQAGKYTASFMLHVDQQGRITHIHLLQSSGSSHLDNDFTQAIGNASFHPFTRQGNPVYGIVMIKLDANMR